MTTCLNCNHHYKGNFCPSCGQKAEVGRITFSVFVYEIIHFITHLEHGFIRTTIDFITKPGAISLNYLKGKRKPYQQPVSYFFIWVSFYVIFHNIIINFHQFHIYNGTEEHLNAIDRGNILLHNHFTLFFGPVLLCSAFIIYLILARPVFNFMEIMTLCLYGAGTYFMILLISDLILGLVFKVNVISNGVFLYQTVLSVIYNFWFSYDIFKKIHFRSFWLRLVLASIFISITGWVLMIYLPLLWMNLFGKPVVK